MKETVHCCLMFLPTRWLCLGSGPSLILMLFSQAPTPQRHGNLDCYFWLLLGEGRCMSEKIRVLGITITCLPLRSRRYRKTFLGAERGVVSLRKRNFKIWLDFKRCL